MINVNKGSIPPPPDMESKPADVTEYAFAPVCDLDHVTGFGKIEINTKDLETLTACRTCGRPARYQTILRTAEAQWVEYLSYLVSKDETIDDRYGWRNSSFRGGYWWTKAERVRNIVL